MAPRPRSALVHVATVGGSGPIPLVADTNVYIHDARSTLPAGAQEFWADAGVVAGTLARTQGFQPHQRRECLNDALVLLTAARAGIAVLTSNRDEFDLIQQLASETRFVHF